MFLNFEYWQPQRKNAHKKLRKFQFSVLETKERYDTNKEIQKNSSWSS
jgi:hypothetical protein